MSEAPRYDVTVATVIRRADGTLFADLGTMVWPCVSERMRAWLADSCRKTALGLVKTDYCENGYTLFYRTRVMRGGELVSDTGVIDVDGLSYEDVCEFERWALTELAEMITMFQLEHIGEEPVRRKRNRLRTLFRWITARWK